MASLPKKAIPIDEFERYGIYHDHARRKCVAVPSQQPRRSTAAATVAAAASMPRRAGAAAATEAEQGNLGEAVGGR